MHKKCTSCGKFVDSSINFCPYCGNPIGKNVRGSKSQTSDGMAGCGLLMFGMIFAVVMLYTCTKGSIIEFFNSIPYQQNIWCGTYNKNIKKVRILEQDIEKGGSTICMASDSWKDSRRIELTEAKKQSFDVYDDKIIIIEAIISNDKFVNVKNVKEWYRETVNKSEVSDNIGTQDNLDKSSKNPNGIVKTYYGNGKIQQEQFWKDGRLEGEIKSYYENGKIKEKGIFKNGKRNGLVQSYYENGNLRSKIYYKDDKPDGIQEDYNIDGSLQGKITYIEGDMKAVKTYYNNGNLKEDIKIKDNKPDGLLKIYMENGKLGKVSNFKDGKMNGKSTEYYENGNIKVENNFQNNELNGISKSYNDEGQLFSECEYKDNKIVGIEKNYYGDGCLCEMIWNDNGLESRTCYDKNGAKIDLNGLVKFYHKNGKLSHELNYKNGKLENISKVYYTNGKLKKEMTFKNDKLNGDIKFYDMAGKLIMTTKYKNDRTVE